MKNKRIYLVVNIFIITIGLLILYFLHINKEREIDKVFQSNLELNNIQYNSIKKYYKVLATNAFNLLINNYDVINIFKLAKDSSPTQQIEIRKKLHTMFQKKYKHLKRLGFRQLHFHLPDNKSFLRMHKPSKFGDDLTDIRYSVKTVNNSLKPIYGFEEGRIVNGFRFVYPLFDKDKLHIGSVEVSVSANGYIKMFQEHFFSDIHFLIKKSVVDKKLFKDEIKRHYHESVESSLFYAENLQSYDDKSNTKVLKENYPYMAEIEHKSRKNKAFVINIEDTKTASFLPIKSIKDKKIIAYFVIYTDTQQILNLNLIYLIFSVIVIMITIILLYLTRREYMYRINIENLNNSLEKRVNSEVEKNRQKDQQMVQQSRLAQMGEMISMIAHQWRQPLNAISLTSSNLKFKCMMDNYDKDIFEKEIDLIDEYSQHLSKTIDDFRGFFKENKEKEETSLEDIVNSTLGIVKTSVETKGITINADLQCDEKFETYPNEIKQVVLNLIKNAEDALQEVALGNVLLDNEIKNPTITIETSCEDKSIKTLIVKDNAGGIPKDIKDKIFDPYFSTKKAKDGTGLGLYMSKTIIEEHCGGRLSVSNDTEGAVFEVRL